MAVYSCFDRVNFKGYPPSAGAQHLNDFVDNYLSIRQVDFIQLPCNYSEQLIGHAGSLAVKHGRPYGCIQDEFRKEDYIDGLIRKHGLIEGFIAVRCSQEAWRTVKLNAATARLC